MLIYCARRGQGYQLGRFWRCPYRIWELTSAPFRVGPHVSQALVLLNWRIELLFALAYRDRITHRARSTLPGAGADQLAALRRMEGVLADVLARLIAARLQLSPWTLHLANIAYSGETSGFDRILGPATDETLFRLGIITALFEGWAAVAWLGAALGVGLVRFSSFFGRVQQALATLDGDPGAIRPFLAVRDLPELVAGLGACGLTEPLYPFLFAVREDGDAARFLAAAETFLSGLAEIFAGGIRSHDGLRAWCEQADLSRCEIVRLTQAMAGDIGGYRRSTFLQRVREHERLAQRVETLLYPT